MKASLLVAGLQQQSCDKIPKIVIKYPFYSWHLVIEAPTFYRHCHFSILYLSNPQMPYLCFSFSSLIWSLPFFSGVTQIMAKWHLFTSNWSNIHQGHHLIYFLTLMLLYPHSVKIQGVEASLNSPKSLTSYTQLEKF